MVLIFSSSIYAEDDNKRFELGNAKKLLFETNRILEAQNNKMVVSEISDYDWFWVSDNKTNDYINNFKQLVSDTNIIQQKRERLNYIFNQKKSLQMTALVPNALNLVNIAFNARDPLKAIIAIGGASVSSASNYFSQKQKDELELLEKQWELDDMQTNTFVLLNGDLRTYLSRISKDYGFSNDDLNSPQTLRSFIKCLNEDNPKKRYSDLNQKQFRDELKVLPEYWAELARAAYEIEEYAEALEFISNYEAIYIKTMYHDERYANIMQIKAYCMLQLDMVSEFGKLSEIADRILENSNQSEWARKYFCVELYKRCFEKTGDTDYLIKAKSMLREVVQNVLDEYKENVGKFYNGSFIRLDKESIESDIKELTELKNSRESFLKANKKKMGDGEKEQYSKEIDDYKKQIEQLEDNKKEIDNIEFQLLPPNSTLLFSLAKEYFDMIVGVRDKQLFGEVREVDSLQYQLISNDLKEYLISDFYQEKLFGKKPSDKNIEIKVDYNPRRLFWDKDDFITIKVPCSYFTFTEDRFDREKDKLFILFNGSKCELNYTYEFERGKKENLSDSFVVFKIKVSSPIKTDFSIKKDEIPVIKLLFDSDSMQFKEPMNVRINNTNDLLRMFVKN